MRIKTNKIINAVVGVMTAVITVLGTAVLPIHATNINFYLDSSRDVIKESSVRLYTNLEKPYGANCTQAGISIYLNGREVMGYTEGYGAFDNYSTWTNLPINYTIGYGQEVDYSLVAGTTYEYKMECYVNGTRYTTEMGTFTMPGTANNTSTNTSGNSMTGNTSDSTTSGNATGNNYIVFEESYMDDLVTNQTVIPEKPPVEPVTPVPVDDSYKGWSQSSDNRWNWMTLGSDPEATMAGYGCLVVSYAKAAVQSGVRSADDFNPGVLLTQLNANDAFYYGGYLKSADEITKVIPEIKYHTTIYNMENWCVDVYNYLNADEHYEIIMETQTAEGTHYMLIDRTDKTDQVYVNNSWKDPASNISVPFTAVSTSYTPSKLIVLKVDVTGTTNNSATVVDEETTITQMQVRTLKETPVLAAPVTGIYTVYKLPENSFVTVCDKILVGSREYYYRTADGKYIKSDYVELVEVQKDGAEIVTIVKDNAPIRKLPTNKGTIIERAEIGDEFEIIEQFQNYKGNLWYKILLQDGTQAFVYSGNVSVK